MKSSYNLFLSKSIDEDFDDIIQPDILPAQNPQHQLQHPTPISILKNRSDSNVYKTIRQSNFNLQNAGTNIIII